MKYESELKVRIAREEDISVIDGYMTEWLGFNADREGSMRRAVKNRELLAAYCQEKLLGFIHHIMHEDIIDGGPNSFITTSYVLPESRNRVWDQRSFKRLSKTR